MPGGLLGGLAEGLKHALSLAAESPARLIVMNVIEGWPEGLPPELTHLSVPEYRRYLERDARDQLRAAEARATSHVEEMLAAGKTYREILRVAGERGADLIVMGVHGRSPIDIMRFGSTTQHVVGPRPVRC